MDVNGLFQSAKIASAQQSAATAASTEENDRDTTSETLFETLVKRRHEILSSSNVEAELSRNMLKNLRRSVEDRKGAQDAGSVSATPRSDRADMDRTRAADYRTDRKRDADGQREELEMRTSTDASRDADADDTAVAATLVAAVSSIPLLAADLRSGPSQPGETPVTVAPAGTAPVGDPTAEAAPAPGTATAPVSPAIQADSDAAARVQASELARDLDPGAKVDIRVRVNAPAATVAPETSPSAGSSTAPAQITAPVQASVVQQAQAVNQGQLVQPAVFQQQMTAAKAEQVAADRQTAVKSAARVETGRADGSSETVRTVAATLAGASGRQARTGSEPSPPQTQAVAAQSGRGSDGGFQTEVTARTSARTTAPETQRVIDQIRVNINKAVDRGVDRITIQLRPASLGRVEVKMEVDPGGQVKATIVADRAETLDMLRADQRGLERALQDAGLKTDGGSLNFELRDQQTADARRDQSSGRPGHAPGLDEAEEDLLDNDTLRARLANQRGGVDVRI